MAFSISFGLLCMCFIMQLFLPGQGQHQWTMSEPPNVRYVKPDCCKSTSKAPIREPVDACYEQKEDFLPCKVHAYIFVTRSNETLCVDPNVWWLKGRLEKLKKRGITCEDLVKSFQQPK